MLTKTHLFGINHLAPNTLQETIDLHAFIEASIAMNITRTMLQNAIDVVQIYVNSKPVYSICLVERYSVYTAEHHEPLAELNRHIQRLVADAFMEFYFDQLQSDALLNITFAIINRHNVIVSFDVYRG